MAEDFEKTTSDIALDDICKIAALNAGAMIAFIFEYGDKKSSVVRGGTGVNIRRLMGNALIPPLHQTEFPFLIAPDLSGEVWFRNHPINKLFPFAKSLIAASIRCRGKHREINLVILNPSTASSNDLSTVATLTELTRVAAFVLNEQSDSELVSEKHLAFASGLSESSSPLQQNANDPTTAFLLKSLIRKRSLKSRRSVTYVTLREWRKAVKDTQIAALTALKLNPSSQSVSQIATEIVEAKNNIYDRMHFSSVIPIPCGSSGHNRCLSVLLAQEIAIQLDVPYLEAIEAEPVVGSSHPRKSARLRPYKLKHPVSGNVLIVDDVASTGTHIEKAMELLRNNGVNPFAIVWIGS